MGKVAKDYVNSMITGLSSDGLFAGMPKHKLLWMMKRIPLLKKPLTEFYNLTQSGKIPNSLLGKILHIAYYRGKLPKVPKIIKSTYEPEEISFPKIEKEFINKILSSGFQEGLTRWLPKIEKTHSAVGNFYSSPFYDREFIKTAFSISDNLKIKNYKEKYILRKAFFQIMPNEFASIPKHPQKMNYDLMFSESLDHLVKKYLSREKVESRGLFDYDQIENLFVRTKNKAYPAEWAMRIWTALLTEIWAIQFIDRKEFGYYLI
jgi:asparagine synthase (glutamine-hydrolysing)